MRNGKQNCRHFVSPFGRWLGDTRVTQAAVMRRPGMPQPQSVRCAGALASSNGRPGLPPHWKPRMDAEAMARMREELAMMAELDAAIPRWGIY